MGVGIKDLFTGGISSVLDSAKGIINQFVPDPAQKAAALQSLQNETDRHQEVILGQVDDLEKARIADTANARDVNAKIQESTNASWLAKNVSYCIDIFLMLIWGAVTIYILARMLNLISKDDKVDFTGVLAMWGGITALATTVVNFHRGSSAGSKSKSEQIEKLTNK